MAAQWRFAVSGVLVLPQPLRAEAPPFVSRWGQLPPSNRLDAVAASNVFSRGL